MNAIRREHEELVRIGRRIRDNRAELQEMRSRRIQQRRALVTLKAEFDALLDGMHRAYRVRDVDRLKDLHPKLVQASQRLVDNADAEHGMADEEHQLWRQTQELVCDRWLCIVPPEAAVQ